MAEGANIDYNAIALRLGQKFRPSAPIDSEDLFYGRTAQVRDVVDAINQAGRHAILYGEAGVGKTSLGKILQTKIRAVEPVPIKCPMVTCDSTDTFDSICLKMFEALDDDAESLDEYPDDIPRAITPNDVRKKLESAGQDGILYAIIDEFDKVTDEESRRLVADTIKLLSDRTTPATIVVIGVADDVNGLIKDHRSTERCLAQVHMPRMPRPELEQIVANGFKAVGMTAEQSVLAEISGLSKGLPHYTHLLALYAGREALDSKSLRVTSEHVEKAIHSAIRQAQESIRTDYDLATNSTRKGTLHKDVLLACSLAETDEFGRFQPSNVCQPLERILGKPMTTDRFASHLHAFCEEDRGPVLVKSGAEYRWKYRFRNPLMQPFVTMKGIASGRITKDELNLLEDPNGQKRMFPR